MSNKSKSTQQRRVKGNGAGDSGDDAMSASPLPSGSSGMMLLQHLQLQDGGSGDGQCSNASGVSLSSGLPIPQQPSEEATMQLRAVVREQVIKLFQEKGDAGVQSFLQQQIQTTKKKESDVAIAKKRGEAAAREKDQLHTELSRANAAKTHAELQCKALQADIKKQDDDVAKAVVDLAANREEVRVKIERDVSELNDKMKAIEAEDAPMEEENAALREECAVLKKEFDDAFKDYETSWSTKEQESAAVVKELQSVLQRTELLDAKLLLMQREAKMMHDSTAVFKEQVATYEDRLSAFEEVSIRTDEVEKIAEIQKAKLQERVDAIEAEKKEAQEIRVLLEKETISLRAKLAALKKKLPLVEKAKLSAEQKCRAAQQKK